MKEIQILNNGDALYDIRRKINENFELVHEKATTEPLVSFGVNEGNETDGVADLLDIDGDTLNFKVGGEYPNLVMTSGDGVTTKIENVNPLYLQNLTDGEYKVVVDGSNSNITDAEFYSQLLEPENPNEGDVWFNGEAAFSYTFEGYTITAQTRQFLHASCLASIDDLCVVAGSGDTILGSRDGGVNWTSVKLPTTNTNLGVIGAEVYNDRIYLVASDGSTYYIDYNLQAQKATAIYTPHNLTRFRKVNDYYIVTSSNGNIMLTQNMVDFQNVEVTTGSLFDVVYTDDTYFALGSNVVFKSYDLLNWDTMVAVNAANCIGVYDDTHILVGGKTGMAYKINTKSVAAIETVQVHANATINDIAVLGDGSVLVVGNNSLCAISNDFKTFRTAFEYTGILNRIYDKFIVGGNGAILNLNKQEQWVKYEYIPIGELTISGGEVTYFTTYPYNTNGLFEATSSTFGLLRTAAEPDELNCHCSDAVITPANLYNLSNYRAMNTSYEVDQKVGCPYHHNLQLNCIQSGTTSNEGLNTKGLLESGTTIEDGTVIWEVQELGTGGGN